MKQSIIVALFMLAFSFQVSAETLPTKIKVVTGDWVPYVSKEYTNNGPIAEIITEIYKRNNIEVEYVYMPWDDGFEAMKEGKFDATMPYYCSNKRKEVAYCSDPIVNGEMVFFHRKDSGFHWSKYEDLHDLTVGMNFGYFYGDDLADLESTGKINIIRSVRDDTSMMALMRHRIDLYPQDKAVGYALIRKLFPITEQKRITHHEQAINHNPLYVLFSKKASNGSHLREMFNVGLKELKSSGKLSEYVAQLLHDPSR